MERKNERTNERGVVLYKSRQYSTSSTVELVYSTIVGGEERRIVSQEWRGGWYNGGGWCSSGCVAAGETREKPKVSGLRS